MTPSQFCGKPMTRKGANLLGKKNNKKLTFLIFIKILLDQARMLQQCLKVFFL